MIANDVLVDICLYLINQDINNLLTCCNVLYNDKYLDNIIWKHTIFRDYGVYNCNINNIKLYYIDIYLSSEQHKLNIIKNSIIDIVENNLSTVDNINFYATYTPKNCSITNKIIGISSDLYSKYNIKLNINNGLFNIKIKEYSDNVYNFISNEHIYTTNIYDFQYNKHIYTDIGFEIINNIIVYNKNSNINILNCLSVLTLFLTKNILLIIIKNNLDKIPNSCLYFNSLLSFSFFVHDAKIYDVIFTENTFTMPSEIYFIYKKSIDDFCFQHSFIIILT